MQIRFFLLLSCLLASNLLLANPNFSNESPDNYYTTLEDGCDLPGPTNFKIDLSGPDWVHLMWDPTNPGYQHRINIYECGDTIHPIKTLVVPAGVNDTTITFTNPPLNIYTYEIRAICTSGDSPHSSWIKCYGGTGVGVIHDLVVDGFIPDFGENGDCSLHFWPGGSDKCYFSSSGTSTFYIRQINNKPYKRGFGLERIYDEGSIFPHVIMHLASPSHPGDHYQFFLNGLQAPPNRFNGTQYEIKDLGGDGRLAVVAVVLVEVDYWTNEMYLKRISVANGYEVVRITDFVPGENPTGNREGSIAPRIRPASASPNPFTETLNVQIPKTAASQVHFQILNLSGQKVFDQNLPGGQGQYTLSTANLANGFYLLRIEADGEVQTLKVVKSE